MIKNPDGTVILTEAEVKSLRKLVTSCNTAINRLVSDGDFLGWDNYYALGMWEDKLKGTLHETSWYIGDYAGKKTVDQWLDAYGKARKRGLA
jgi:hypothetical protein